MTARGEDSPGQRVCVRAVGRGDHVAGLERAAGADGDRLLADREVDEARYLAVAVALLDGLLESPDHEHPGQEAL